VVLFKHIFFAFLIIGLHFTGCVKDNNLITDSGAGSFQNDTLNTTALLEWHGEYATDGCGFIIEINEREYKAVNEEVIDESFKLDFSPILVWIEYVNLNKKQGYYCGDSPFALKYDVIEILSIERL
jgi:hypothetical protein